LSTARDYALKAHSRKLEEAVFHYAHLAAYSCHEHFIGESLKHDSKEYDEFHKAFSHLWDQLVAEGRRSHDERETISLRFVFSAGRDLPSTFRDHLDFLEDLLVMVARRIFRFLLDIAGEDGVPWAREQALRLVRDIDWRKVVAVLIREACGGEGGDAEAWLFPAWLRMKPAGPYPYDAERAARRLDAAGTEAALNYFVVEIVGKLEGCIEEAAGEEYQRVATLEAAQRREPKLIEASQTAEQIEEPAAQVQMQAQAGRAGWTQQDWIDWATAQEKGTKVNPVHTMKIFDIRPRTLTDWAKYGFRPETTGNYDIELIWKWLDTQYRKQVRADYRLRAEE
jgi:hypothetical protein